MNKIQIKSQNIVKKIDKKYNVKRNAYFSFSQLAEELGELARAINLPKLRNQKLDRKNLKEEFADVLILLCALAGLYKIDLEKAVEEKTKELKTRHNIK
jgi:NTP pyrophosphatase (non-canonical NTP hydrolase)